MMASAPRVCALATNLSRVTGTNSSERQAGRSGRELASDDPLGAKLGKVGAVDADARQDLGGVLAELRAPAGAMRPAWPTGAG